MKIKFWGVRGSVPTSNRNSDFYGGNTTCLEIVSETGKRVIIDAGTGIRDLGTSLLGQLPVEVALFFSHYHWDHIQGFPFFVPAFIPGNKIHFYGQAKGELSVENILVNLMSAPNFPVPMAVMGSEKKFVTLQESGRVDIDDNFYIQYAPIYHPNECIGFRIVENERVFTFMTDVEHVVGAPPEANALMLSQGADYVAYDCQYTPEEFEGKISWGHSTWEAGLELVKQAKARRLLMIHHDPNRTDDQINKIAEEAGEQAVDFGVNVMAAYEGLELELK